MVSWLVQNPILQDGGNLIVAHWGALLFSGMLFLGSLVLNLSFLEFIWCLAWGWAGRRVG